MSSMMDTKISLLDTLFQERILDEEECWAYWYSCDSAFAKIELPTRKLADFVHLIDVEEKFLEKLREKRWQKQYFLHKDKIEDKINENINKQIGLARRYFSQQIDDGTSFSLIVAKHLDTLNLLYTVGNMTIRNIPEPNSS